MGALIAAGVIVAAGAATAGAMSASAAGKAAKAQGAAAKKAAKADRSAMASREKAIKKFGKGQKLLEADIAAIPMPVRDPEANMREAERITGYNMAQLDRLYGGQYKNLEDLALRAINDRLSGRMTQSAREATMRESAYMQGAGFNPATARTGAITQRGPFDYLRAIGQSTEQAVTQGFNMMGDWTNLVRGFIANPLAVSQDSLAYQMGAANVGLQKVNTRRQMLSDFYNAQLGGAEAQQQMGQRQYARQQENIAASLAAREREAAMVKDTSAAVGSAVAGGAGAYGQYAAAQGASTTPTSSGFYTGQLGAANAYGVAPSQLSYQQPTGGFMGIGGQGGGYYYTPGGVYGRT